MFRVMLYVTAVLCGVVLSAWAQTHLDQSCFEPKAKPSLSFSVFSARNVTGHWVAEVVMEEGADDPLKNGGWLVEVDRSTVDFRGLRQVVQIKATTTSASSTLSRYGYEFFPGIGYYKFHTVGKTWEEARQLCAVEGGHLVILNTEMESAVLQELYARFPDLGGPHVAAFIGFHDKQIEGQYVTIDGKPLESTGFMRWSTFNPQPDNAGPSPGEDCGSVHRNGGLNDYNCDNIAPFFCEKELGSAFTKSIDKNREVEIEDVKTDKKIDTKELGEKDKIITLEDKAEANKIEDIKSVDVKEDKNDVLIKDVTTVTQVDEVKKEDKDNQEVNHEDIKNQEAKKEDTDKLEEKENTKSDFSKKEDETQTESQQVDGGIETIIVDLNKKGEEKKEEVKNEGGIRNEEEDETKTESQQVGEETIIVDMNKKGEENKEKAKNEEEIINEEGRPTIIKEDPTIGEKQSERHDGSRSEVQRKELTKEDDFKEQDAAVTEDTKNVDVENEAIVDNVKSDVINEEVNTDDVKTNGGEGVELEIGTVKTTRTTQGSDETIVEGQSEDRVKFEDKEETTVESIDVRIGSEENKEIEDEDLFSLDTEVQ